MHRQAYFDWSQGARLLTPLPLLKLNTFDMQALGTFVDYAERGESEKEWQSHLQTTEWHAKRAEKAIEMLENNTLVLTDPTPDQISRKNLFTNLEATLAIMKRNMENRTRYSEVNAKFGKR